MVETNWLSQAQIEHVQNQLDKAYTHKMRIITLERVEDEYGISKEQEVMSEVIPCRVSFLFGERPTELTQHAPKPIQQIKLFLRPNINVPIGSKLLIEHDNRTDKFKSSGVPAMYPTHQEIVLLIADDYA